MLATILVTALVTAIAVYYLHPSHGTLLLVKDEVEKVEKELSTELAKADALGKAGITAAQAEAKSVIARIKALL